MLVIISATWIVQLIHFVTLLLIDNSKRPTRVYFDLIFENCSRISVCLSFRFNEDEHVLSISDMCQQLTVGSLIMITSYQRGETSRSGLMIRSIWNFSQPPTGKDNQSFTSEDNPRWKHKVPSSSWRDSRFTFERCRDDGYLCRLSGCISTREFEFIAMKTNELERRGDLQETKSESMFLPSLPNEKWSMNTCSVAIFSLSIQREKERERIREIAWHFIEVSIDPVSGHWPGRMLLSSIGISSFSSVLDDRQSLDWTSTLPFNPAMHFYFRSIWIINLKKPTNKQRTSRCDAQSFVFSISLSWGLLLLLLLWLPVCCAPRRLIITRLSMACSTGYWSRVSFTLAK